MKRVAKVIGFVGGAIAVIWAMRDRFISVATSREPEPPAFRSAIPSPPVTEIEGIGPVIFGILQKSGITTFRQLADADVKKIQQMLHNAGITGIADPATWPMQAEFAAAGEWQQLDKLQEELKGGRVVREKV